MQNLEKLKTIKANLKMKNRRKINKLRDRFSKSEIKEIRRDLYEIENKKNSFYTKNKRDWKKSFWIRKNIFKADKKYYDYDDIKYKGIRDVKNVFDLSIDKDY